MRILVCGGRDFGNQAHLETILNGLTMGRPTVTIIHGACRGADAFADQWAKEKGIPVISVPAEWHIHGKAAGPIRNKKMLEMLSQDDLVVAFPGSGRGTWNTINQARSMGLNVRIF